MGALPPDRESEKNYGQKDRIDGCWDRRPIVGFERELRSGRRAPILCESYRRTSRLLNVLAENLPSPSLMFNTALAGSCQGWYERALQARDSAKRAGGGSDLAAQWLQFRAVLTASGPMPRTSGEKAKGAIAAGSSTCRHFFSQKGNSKTRIREFCLLTTRAPL